MIWYIVLYFLGVVFSTAAFIHLNKYVKEEDTCKFLVGYLSILRLAAVVGGLTLLFFKWEILRQVAAFLLGFASPFFLGKNAQHVEDKEGTSGGSKSSYEVSKKGKSYAEQQREDQGNEGVVDSTVFGIFTGEEMVGRKSNHEVYESN